LIPTCAHQPNYKCSFQARSFLPLPSRVRYFFLRVASTWEPSRLQRGPYTGRGAKPAGLVSDRTRSFGILKFSLRLWNFSPIHSPYHNHQSHYINHHNSLFCKKILSCQHSSSSPAHSLPMSPYIMVTHPSILLIEDSPDECELFRLALMQTGLDVTLYADGLFSLSR
jgi:CheY-like chemotaxis protein